MEHGCEAFGELYLNDENGYQIPFEDLEFNELVHRVKQKCVESADKKKSDKFQTLKRTNEKSENERTHSFLLTINFNISQTTAQIDNVLILSIVHIDTKLPMYESFRITDLLTGEPVHILLEDVDLSVLDQLELKIMNFETKLQELPNFFVDETQYEMLSYEQTVFFPISTYSSQKTIDLGLSNKMMLRLNGEILEHKNRNLLKQVKIYCYATS